MEVEGLMQLKLKSYGKLPRDRTDLEMSIGPSPFEPHQGKRLLGIPGSDEWWDIWLVATLGEVVAIDCSGDDQRTPCEIRRRVQNSQPAADPIIVSVRKGQWTNASAPIGKTSCRAVQRMWHTWHTCWSNAGAGERVACQFPTSQMAIRQGSFLLFWRVHEYVMICYLSEAF